MDLGNDARRPRLIRANDLRCMYVYQAMGKDADEGARARRASLADEHSRSDLILWNLVLVRRLHICDLNI